jgi:FkbM family methyltransferase
MPDTFEDVATLEFVEKLVNGKYSVKVPKFLDQHQWWGNWERERFNSMEELLKPGMVLYEIGAFDGWQDVILSRFVGGGQNMILIEPVAENWANTKATWEANGVEKPAVTYMGLVGPEETTDELTPWFYSHDWPLGPDYSRAISVTKFKHIAEHALNTPCCPLDDFVEIVLTPKPSAINIDVEGAELLVLQSAKRTLERHSPLVWVSIHPEFMKTRYYEDDSAVHEFMADLGYKGTFLGSDHEQHWCYRKDA